MYIVSQGTISGFDVTDHISRIHFFLNSVYIELLAERIKSSLESERLRGQERGKTWNGWVRLCNSHLNHLDMDEELAIFRNVSFSRQNTILPKFSNPKFHLKSEYCWTLLKHVKFSLIIWNFLSGGCLQPQETLVPVGTKIQGVLMVYTYDLQLISAYSK